MWRDSFKVPKSTKVFNGETYRTIGHIIDLTKKDAQERAKQHKKNGWKIRIVKFEYQKTFFGYVLYGIRQSTPKYNT